MIKALYQLEYLMTIQRLYLLRVSNIAEVSLTDGPFLFLENYVTV